MSLFTKLLKNHALPLKSQGISMFPILRPDDTVYFKKTPFPQIKVDDLIIFQKKGQLIVHRVISKIKKHPSSTLRESRDLFYFLKDRSQWSLVFY